MPGRYNRKLLDPRDRAWLAFAESHSDANIFHHPAWIELLSRNYGYRPFIMALVDGSGEVVAGLPMMEIRSILTGRRWVSLPYTDYCIPLCRADDALPELCAWLVEEYERGHTPRIGLRWQFPPCDGIVNYSDCVLHLLKLAADVEQVQQGFKRTHRQNIATAQARGVRIVQGSGLEEARLYYRLQLETRRRHGVPVQPLRFFDELARTVFSQGLGFVMLAYKGEECLAGIVLLHWNRSLIAKYAASREDRLNLRPNNLLFWEGIHWGCENGYELFDMGRAEAADEGLRRYKRGWGAEEIPLTYASIGATQEGRARNRMQHLLKTVLQKSPLWVTRVTGELLYRHFG